MKSLILAIIAVSMIGGCSAIEAGKVEDCIKRAADVTELICTTGKIFEAAGVDVPGVEQCEKAMKKANSFLEGPEYAAIASTAKCVDKFKPNSEEFVQCIDDVDGIKLLAEKINKRAR